MVFFFISFQVELLYNVVPISALQQSDPIIHTYIYTYIYIYILFLILSSIMF